MKQLIVFIAIIAVMAPMIFFTSDFKQKEMDSRITKNYAKEISSSLTLYFNEEEYSKGKYIFDENKIKEYLDNYVPDKYVYIVYLFDERLQLMKFSKDKTTNKCKLISEKKVSFNSRGEYKFIDDYGKEILLKEPVIISIIYDENDKYRLDNLSSESIIKRSSMTIIDTRGAMEQLYKP